jgi:hypothetical protein
MYARVDIICLDSRKKKKEGRYRNDRFVFGRENKFEYENYFFFFEFRTQVDIPDDMQSFKFDRLGLD